MVVVVVSGLQSGVRHSYLHVFPCYNKASSPVTNSQSQAESRPGSQSEGGPGGEGGGGGSGRVQVCGEAGERAG